MNNYVPAAHISLPVVTGKWEFKQNELITIILAATCITLLSFLVTAIFFRNDVWVIVIVTATVSLICHVLVAFYYIQDPMPFKVRIFFILLLSYYITASVMLTNQFYYQSNFQKDSLVKVRSVIDHSVYLSSVKKTLTDVFIAYHKQIPGNIKPVGRLYEEMYIANKENAKNLEWLNYDGTEMHVISLSAEEVILMGIHQFTKGKNPNFRNYNGRTGLIQVKGTLTSEGVKYAIEN